MSHAMIIGEGAGKKLLDAVSVIGPSEPWFPVAANKTFHVIITGTATVTIEVTNDATLDDTPTTDNWVTLATVTTSGGVENSQPWKAVRARVVSLLVGTVTVILGT